MNNITRCFLIVFVLFQVSSASAQLKLGLTGGANFSTIRFDGASIPTENIMGYFIGVLPRVVVTEKFNLSVEAQYSAKGFGLPSDTSTQYKIEYVDLIPQFEYNVLRGLWVGLGFNFAVKISEKSKTEVENSWIKINNAHFVRNLDAGLKVFTRIFITKKINVSAALNTGIVNIEAFKFTDQNGDPIASKQLNRNVQIGVGYTFGGIK